VTIRASGRLAGSVRWAVVPYAPRPPFRLYAGEGTAPIDVRDTNTIIASAKRGGDSEFTYLVSGKARPVLVLNEPPAAHHREITALRLLRFSKLTDDEQTRVRRQDDPLLFHLDPQRFDLAEENAAMITALVRLHVDALDVGPSMGELNPDEMRLVGERIITFYRFDTRLLVERQIRELVARRRVQDES
jgi:hypothetical protein